MKFFLGILGTWQYVLVVLIVFSKAMFAANCHKSALDFPDSLRDSGSAFDLGGQSVRVYINSRLLTE